MTDVRGKFVTWVVYDRPTDYPDGYIARLWLDMEPQQVTVRDATLDGIRRKLPPDLTLIPRSPGDDPCIAEVWV